MLYLAYTGRTVLGELRGLDLTPEHRLRIQEIPTLNTSSMGKTTRYKYDEETGQLLFSHEFCQQEGESLREYLDRIDEEWGVMCERWGG